MKRYFAAAMLTLSLLAFGAPGAQAGEIAPDAACNAGTMNAHSQVPETTGTGVPVAAHEHIPEATDEGCIHEAFEG